MPLILTRSEFGGREQERVKLGSHSAGVSALTSLQRLWIYADVTEGRCQPLISFSL